MHSKCKICSIILLIIGVIAANPLISNIVNNRSAIKDEPFFWGVYSLHYDSSKFPGELQTAKNIGFDIVQSYALEGILSNGDNPSNSTPLVSKIEYCKSYLNSAHEHGLKILHGIPKNLIIDIPNVPQVTDDVYGADREAQLTAFIKELDNHPANKAWYFFDEPSAIYTKEMFKDTVIDQKDTVVNYYVIVQEMFDAFKGAYKLIKQISNKAVITAECDVDHFEFSHYFSDLIAPDLYPIYKRKDDNSFADLYTFTEFVERNVISNSLTNEKPIIPVIQAYNFYDKPKGPYTSSQLRNPSDEELRYMIYTSLTQGAQGLMFYNSGGFSTVSNYLQDTLAPIISEAKELLVEIEPVPDVIRIPQYIKNEKVHIGLWSGKNNNFWLIVTNGNMFELENFNFSIKDYVSEGVLIPWKSNRNIININDGNVELQMSPFEVLICKINFL